MVYVTYSSAGETSKYKLAFDTPEMANEFAAVVVKAGGYAAVRAAAPTDTAPCFSKEYNTKRVAPRQYASR